MTPYEHRVESLRLELELDWTWRQDELLKLQNCFAQVGGTTEQQDQFRRTLVVMLYAHFEGFTKFVFLAYARFLTLENLECKDVNACFVVATHSNTFRALQDVRKKAPIFRKTLPNDTKLHRTARQIEFIEAFKDLARQKIQIPDEVVDTESNLTPIVFKKLLFLFGLEEDPFKPFLGPIQYLLNMRNKISHGELKGGIEEQRFLQLRDAVFNTARELMIELTKTCRNRDFLKTSA